MLSQSREHRRAQLFSDWDSDGETSEPDPSFELDGRLEGAQLKDPAWLAATAPEFISKVAAQAAPKGPAAAEAAAEPPPQVFKLTLVDAAVADACATGLSFVVDSCLPVRTRLSVAPPRQQAQARRVAPARKSPSPQRGRSGTPTRRPSSTPRAASAERLARLAQPQHDRAELTRRSSEKELQVMAAQSVHKTKLTKTQAEERVAKMEAWEAARQAKLDDARARKKFAEAEEEGEVAPASHVRNNITMSERDLSDVVGRLATPKKSRPGGQRGSGSGSTKGGMVGGESNVAWSRDLRASSTGPVRSSSRRSAGARVVAEETGRKKKGGILLSAADEKQAFAARQGARKKASGGAADGSGPSIFDKLTDSSNYTGAHKERFDKSGKGRRVQKQSSPAM